MLSIERLLVLVEQYIITVEVCFFSGTKPMKIITYKGFLELMTSECKCQVYEGMGFGNHTPLPTPPLCILVIFSNLC